MKAFQSYFASHRILTLLETCTACKLAYFEVPKADAGVECQQKSACAEAMQIHGYAEYPFG